MSTTATTQTLDDAIHAHNRAVLVAGNPAHFIDVAMNADFIGDLDRGLLTPDFAKELALSVALDMAQIGFPCLVRTCMVRNCGDVDLLTLERGGYTHTDHGFGIARSAFKGIIETAYEEAGLI